MPPDESRVPTGLHLTPAAIQVLAHPLRSRLLSALRLDGPATATALAEQLGTNTGATSYHLRKLASVGLVEETGEGRGRERWWRSTTQMHDWDDTVAEGDPNARAAATWLRGEYLRTFIERADRWLAEHDSWPIEWRRVAGSSDYVFELTPDELEELMNELWAVLAGYSDRLATGQDGAARPPRPGARRVFLFIHDFPEGESPS